MTMTFYIKRFSIRHILHDNKCLHRFCSNLKLERFLEIFKQLDEVSTDDSPLIHIQPLTADYNRLLVNERIKIDRNLYCHFCTFQIFDTKQVHLVCHILVPTLFYTAKSMLYIINTFTQSHTDKRIA